MDNTVDIDFLKERISSVPGIAAAYLFGSAVKGSMKRESDIDVAVLFDDEHAPTADKLEIMTELSRTAGRDVD
ncbi:MAG TPA: nucleotidyltransferase domain-containing protein, partial [Spirochaetota bacterium]|nr:nucleotidyltransferase domain-containing protein [Spirochaetota bacterium]